MSFSRQGGRILVAKASDPSQQSKVRLQETARDIIILTARRNAFRGRALAFYLIFREMHRLKRLIHLRLGCSNQPQVWHERRPSMFACQQTWSGCDIRGYE